MKRVICLLGAAAMFAGLAVGQEVRCAILGHVKDVQGAMIPNATVVVTNTDTNVNVRLTSNESGYYEAPLLLPGPYSVSAEMSGFKKTVRTGIVLLVSDRRDVDVVLEVGAISESVSVTAEAPLVDVTRTDSGKAIDDRSVQDLPVMADTVFTMIRYAAGVQAGGPPILLGPHSTQGGSDYNNGTGVGGNAWTIDGAVNDGNARYTANLPSVDAVAETKIVTNTFDGSFGHSTGLGVAVVTKSGSNDFHGVLTENYWNQRWQGANLFTKQNYYTNINSLLAKGDTAGAASAASKPIQPAGHSNLYSITATGPIWIPKIFNGKNKVFFSFNFNGERDAKPEESSTYNRVVPTPAEKKGDFSDLLQVAQNPAQFQLYDPLSVKADPNRPGHYLRTPLAGNVLPASYINMGSKFYNSYVKYWPDPNNWFDHSQIPNVNPFLSIDTPYNWKFDQYSGRMDVNLGSKMRLFGRYTQNHFLEYRGDWTIDIMPGLNNQNSAGSGVWRDDQNGVLDWVYTINSNTILHAASSISNWSSQATVLDTPFTFKPSDAGLPTYMDDKCALTRCYLPWMNINGYAQNGISGIPNPVYNRFNTENVDLYHNRGKHALRFGLDFRQQIRSIHAGNNDGQYYFNNTYFRQCDDSCASNTYSAGTIGLSWASFMMGLPSPGSSQSAIGISGNDSAYVGNPYWSWFGQDTWRVAPKLTLTVSLRMEFEQGATERFNRAIIDVDQTATLPITAAAQAAYAANPIPELPVSQFKALGGAVYAGTPGARSRAWGSQLMYLPRLGFGYQINEKTVIRGGYGIYYDTLNVNAVSYGPNQQGYSLGTNTTVFTNDSNNIPVFNSAWNVAGLVSPLTDPFPLRSSANNTRFDTTVGNAMGLMALGGINSFTYPAEKHARMQRWQIGIERQIGSHDVVEVAYAGSFTSDININSSISAVPATFYSFANSRPAANCTATLTSNCLNDSYLGQSVTNPFALANFASLQTSNPALYKYMQSTNSFYTSGTITRANLLKAFPQSNLTVPNPAGHARSQGISISFNHRFSHGLTANFAYSGGVQKQATTFFQPWSPLDSTLPQQPYWVVGGAVPYRLTATWVYDLPFGKGRHWLNSGISSYVAGGWTLAGTYEASPGGLLGFGNNFYYGDLNQIKVDNPTFGHWFNTAGCVTQNPGPGDIVVASGPCTQGWDKRSGSQPGTYQARVLPQNIAGIRGPGYQQWNTSVYRSFKFKERVAFETRLDVLNLLNHSFPGGPNTTPTSSQFGQITSGAANLNRFVQIQGHLRW